MQVGWRKHDMYYINTFWRQAILKTKETWLLSYLTTPSQVRGLLQLYGLWYEKTIMKEITFQNETIVDYYKVQT
jgi:hypothetical protein